MCISDNNSSDETEDVVRAAQSDLEIKYHKNTSNLGIPRNFLKVVSMADGDFVWLVGDDDLVMPNAVSDFYALVEAHPNVDFFYANSYHLNTEYLQKFPSPFDTLNLPQAMKQFSSWCQAGVLDFFELISPKISFDFLGGMYLSIFRKQNWDRHAHVLDAEALHATRTFSHFDNTFPHVKIFASAFASSKAYFNPKPLSVSLTGAREWSPMYPLIHSVRLIEALGEYRKKGLPYWKYLYCRNYALNNFIPDLLYIILNRKTSGYDYISPIKLLLANCIYPNFYLSSFYFLGRRFKRIFNRISSRLIEKGSD